LGRRSLLVFGAPTYDHGTIFPIVQVSFQEGTSTPPSRDGARASPFLPVFAQGLLLRWSSGNRGDDSVSGYFPLSPSQITDPKKSFNSPLHNRDSYLFIHRDVLPFSQEKSLPQRRQHRPSQMPRLLLYLVFPGVA